MPHDLVSPPSHGAVSHIKHRLLSLYHIRRLSDRCKRMGSAPSFYVCLTLIAVTSINLITHIQVLAVKSLQRHALHVGSVIFQHNSFKFMQEKM